jgi:protein gp37
MGKTKIEWTEYSLNPFKGCSKVSSGCQHCYAEVMARRLQAMGKRGYEGVIDKNGWTGRVNFVPEVLDKLAEWKKPKRIFINSMSDTFHEHCLRWWHDHLFKMMIKYNQHTYYILTKRPHNIPEIIINEGDNLDHIWLGVTVESQKHVGRVDQLCEAWPGRKFVSIEPCLDAVDLRSYLPPRAVDMIGEYDPAKEIEQKQEFMQRTLNAIRWVIVGGESGHGARPLYPGWARSLRDQALQAGVPFFFKQWGEWLPCWQTPADGPVWMGIIDAATFSRIDKELRKRDPDPNNGMSDYSRVGKKTAGRMLDGREWNEIPE